MTSRSVAHSIVLSWAVLGVAAILLSGCQQAPQKAAASSTSDAAAVAAIMDFNRKSLKALNEGDVAALNALVADEYTMILPNRPPTSGRAAIQAGNASFLGQWHDVENWIPAETIVSGDWGFQRGTFEMTMTPKQGGGEPRHVTGNYLHVYHRQPDGRWLLARAMTN